MKEVGKIYFIDYSEYRKNQYSYAFYQVVNSREFGDCDVYECKTLWTTGDVTDIMDNKHFDLYINSIHEERSVDVLEYKTEIFDFIFNTLKSRT